MNSTPRDKWAHDNRLPQGASCATCLHSQSCGINDRQLTSTTCAHSPSRYENRDEYALREMAEFYQDQEG